MHETFRIQRKFRSEGLIGMICTPIVGLIGGLGLYLKWSDPQMTHPLRVAYSGGTLLLILFAMSVWLLVAYRKTRLVIDGDRVVKIGILGRKEIRLREVTQARWKSRRPSGDMGIIFGIVLISPMQRLRIELREFEVDPPDLLIRYFRDNIDPSIQSGWEGVELVQTLKSAPKVAVRGYWDFFFLSFVLIMSPFLVVGAWDKAMPFLGGILAMWGLIHIATRGRAEVVRAESKTELVRQTRGLLIIAAIAMTVLASARELVADDLIQAAVKLATILLWFFGNMGYWLATMIRMNRRDRESILSRGAASPGLDE